MEMRTLARALKYFMVDEGLLEDGESNNAYQRYGID